MFDLKAIVEVACELLYCMEFPSLKVRAFLIYGERLLAEIEKITFIISMPPATNETNFRLLRLSG